MLAPVIWNSDIELVYSEFRSRIHFCAGDHFFASGMRERRLTETSIQETRIHLASFLKRYSSGKVDVLQSGERWCCAQYYVKLSIALVSYESVVLNS